MAETDHIGPTEGADRAFEEEERRDRMYVLLGTVLLVILLVIVFLFLWRSCSGKDEGLKTSSTGGQILSVPGLDPVDNAISAWTRPGMDMEAVLDRNGVVANDIVDLGEDTYVIAVDDPEEAIEALKSDPDLYDVGFIYSEE